MLKDLLGETIQTMLEGEIEEELGYSKYNYDEKNTQNSREWLFTQTEVSMGKWN